MIVDSSVVMIENCVRHIAHGDLTRKTKLEMVLPDAMVEKVVQAILVAARTGKIGDGKIFLTRVDEAIRIRNEERGEGAL